MAQQEEPMDIDSSVCDFDNKENAYQHSNVLPRTPCTEKGYEELDVSELNMKLRYSITPTSTPMSKSYTANCVDNETDNASNVHGGNLTRSMNSTLTKNDSIVRAQTCLPLQTLPMEQGHMDTNRNALRQLDTTVNLENNITVALSTPKEYDQLSMPSSSSSLAHTPEATTPTTALPKNDQSPIMRGLTSVLNMFRPSQSPIPPEDAALKPEVISPPIISSPENSSEPSQPILASTPLSIHKTRDPLSKKHSPTKDSLVFNEDLEKELEWKDETTIIFSNKEKIPIHKLFFQSGKSFDLKQSTDKKSEEENLENAVEFMDISYNDSVNKTFESQAEKNNISEVGESDSEFVDCESTFTKNESHEISFKSQETDENVTKDVISLRNVSNEQNSNDSEETLNATVSMKSDDVSISSTNIPKADGTFELKKHEDDDNKVIVFEENVTQSNQVEIVQPYLPTENKKLQAEPGLIISNIDFKENSITNLADNHSTKACEAQELEHLVNDVVCENLISDNVGVHSLSAIPLICDPRVLLFNVSSDNVPNTENLLKENVVTEEKHTDPADIPLPPDTKTETALLDDVVDNKQELGKPLPNISQVVRKDIKLVDSKISSEIVTESYIPSLGDVDSSQVNTIADINSDKAEVVVANVIESVIATFQQIVETNSQDVKERICDNTFNLDETNVIINAIEDEISSMSQNSVKSSNMDISINEGPDNSEIIDELQKTIEKLEGQNDQSLTLNQTQGQQVSETVHHIEDMAQIISVSGEKQIQEMFEDQVVSVSMDTNILKSDRSRLNAANLTGFVDEAPGILAAEVGLDSVINETKIKTTDDKNTTFDTVLQEEIKMETLSDRTKFNTANSTDLAGNASAVLTAKAELDPAIAVPNIMTTDDTNSTYDTALHEQIKIETTSQKSKLDTAADVPAEVTAEAELDSAITQTKGMTTDDNNSTFATVLQEKIKIEKMSKRSKLNAAADVPAEVIAEAELDFAIVESETITDDKKSTYDTVLQEDTKMEITKNTAQPWNGSVEIKDTIQNSNDIINDLNNTTEMKILRTVELKTNEVFEKHIITPSVVSSDQNTISAVDQVSSFVADCKQHLDEVLQDKRKAPILVPNKLMESDSIVSNLSDNIVSENKNVTPITEDTALESTEGKTVAPDSLVAAINEVDVCQEIKADNRSQTPNKLMVSDFIVSNLSDNIVSQNKNVTPITEGTALESPDGKTVAPDSLVAAVNEAEVCQEIKADNKSQTPNTLIESESIVSKLHDNIVSETPITEGNALKSLEGKTVTPESLVAAVNEVEVCEEIKADNKSETPNNFMESYSIISNLSDQIVSENKNVTPITEGNAIESPKGKTRTPDSLVAAVNEVEVCQEIKADDKSETLFVKCDDQQPSNDNIVLPEKAIAPVSIVDVCQKDGPFSAAEDTKNTKEVLEKQDEIVASENNSPFVSISSEFVMMPEPKSVDDFEQVHMPSDTNAVPKYSRPESPKIISSKTYNLNFDEIEDPFATRTKIRASPPPGATPNESFNETYDANETKIIKRDSPKKDFNKDRRKSQSLKKRPPPSNKKLNSKFSGSSKEASKSSHKKIETVLSSKIETVVEKSQLDTTGTLNTAAAVKLQDILATNMNITVQSEKPIDESTIEQPLEHKEQIDNTTSIESVSSVAEENKPASSSEQSTYFSVGTSSSDDLEPKSSYNIPELSDNAFNPFASNSKLRQSPPPEPNDQLVIKTKLDSSVDILPQSDDKELLSHNITNTTSSSRKANTEDEDTIEGPFLEAEDFNDERALHPDNKMIDFGEPDEFMQFSDLPAGSEENADAGEMFIDAEAFEFLLNQNQNHDIADSGKESLFLKFDPLFAKRVSSDGIVSALKYVQKKQSTPKKTTQPEQSDATFITMSPDPGPSCLNMTNDIHMNSTTEESIEDLNITVAKPMMVVNPAVNPIATTRIKPTTPVASNRRSLTFTSPAIAVIDRLLSLSMNNSAHEAAIVESAREQNEAHLALTQLRQHLAEKETVVDNLKAEARKLGDRLFGMESQVKSLEAISEERLKKINELTEKLNEKTKLNKSMAMVVEEYERTIARLIAEKEEDKKQNAEERVQLIRERDEQTAHLASMEVSFSDLHSKYEKAKQLILGFKANEEMCKKSIKDFEENISKMQNNYELLKQHATSKLNHANEELQKMNRAHEAEVLKLTAMIKRKDLNISSLEETLAQKTKANEELTAICDELINKVSTRL